MSREEPEIELVADSQTEPRIISRPRPQHPVAVVGKIGAAPPAPPTFLHLDAVATIMASLPEGRLVEAGGLLVGYNCADADGRYLLVIDAIPATLAAGQRLSLTFTHEAWDQMLDRKQHEYPDEQIVGWYHSHPGLGVFLSGRDLFIHQHFFADTMQIALVIDPADFTWGLFCWRNKELVAATAYYIYGQADNTYEALDRLLGKYRANWQITRRPYE